MHSVLITGASTGIGRQCALDLSQAGWWVFAGVRKMEDGKSLQAKSSGSLTPLILDVTDKESVEQAAQELEEELMGKGLDALVNNAGITVQGPMEFIPLSLFEKQMQVNVTGQLLVTQAFLPLLRKARGRIVFMSSESGRITLPMLGPYSASKFALEAIANALRIELLPSGIRVSLIEPGSVKTDIWDKSLKTSAQIMNDMPEQARQIYKKELPLLIKMPQWMNKTAATPQSVSKVVMQALNARSPRIRYLVGIQGRLLMAFYAFAPTRMADWITSKIAGLLSRFI